MIGSKQARIRRDALVDLVDLVERNVSSIDMISSHLGLSPEETQQMLLELVKKGRISGKLAPDGTRFFRTDIKTSDAPTIESISELDHKRQNAKPGFLIMMCGIALYIVGNILVNLTAESEIFWTFGSALLFAGPLVLIAGLFYVSKMNPPQEQR